MEEKRIYIIKDFKNKRLEKQLARADDELDLKTAYMFNRDTLICNQGEIYESLFIDQLSHQEYKIKVVVMSSSGEYEQNVLVCPLIDVEHKEIATQGIVLGTISSLNDGITYFARVSSLKTINKNALRVNPNMRLQDIKPVGHISTSHFIAILNGYKRYLKFVINNNTDCELLDRYYQLDKCC